MRYAVPLCHPIPPGGSGEGHPLDAELDALDAEPGTSVDVSRDSSTPATGPAPPPPSRPMPVPRRSIPPSTAGPPPGGAAPPGKIRTFQQTMGAPRSDDSDWKRRPRSDGTGAVHVKSFHCKLSAESLEYLDQQINEWLDDHPTFEVKQVTTTVGEWTGKLREPALIVNVWV